MGLGPTAHSARKSLGYGFKFGSPVGRGRSSFGHDAYDYFNPEHGGKDPGLDRTGRFQTQGYHGFPGEMRQWGGSGYGDMPVYDNSSTHPGRPRQFDSYEQFEDPHAGKRKYETSDSKTKFDPYTGERIAPPSPKARFDPYTGRRIDDSGPSPVQKKTDRRDVTGPKASDDIGKKRFEDEVEEFDVACDSDLALLLHSSTPNKPNQKRGTRAQKDTKIDLPGDMIDNFTVSEERARREEELAKERDKELQQAESKIKKFKPYLTRRITESHLATMKQEISSVHRYIVKSTPGGDSFFHAVIVDCPEFCIMDPDEANKRLRRQLSLYIVQQEHFTTVSYHFMRFLKSATY